MTPSTQNNYNLADLVNTVKHVLIVVLAGALESLLSGLQSGQIMDWTSFQKALIIAGLTGLLVGLNRYFKDNSTGQTDGQSQVQ